MRVLIIGGYGTFGGRLVDLLIDEPRLTLIVAGRDLARAQRFCAARTRAATLEAAQFDRAVPEAALAALRPDIVVDAAGPFQLYGRDPYRVVRAALAAGAHWIDLADAVGFVKGIAAFDGEARAAGRFVLAGASSFPVLTAAVVRRTRPRRAADRVRSSRVSRRRRSRSSASMSSVPLRVMPASL